MKEITDPELLNQLNARQEVTDPKILAQLESPYEYSGLETLKNIPSSAGQYAKDLTAPIHSYDTFWPGMVSLAKGVAEKVIPGEQEHEKYADAAGRHFSNRYGENNAYPEEGINNFTDYMKYKNKNKMMTFQRDPVGTLSDLSLAGSLASLPLKGTIAGGKFNKAAIAADPVNAVINSSKYVTSKLVPKNMPAKMYESSAKFSTTIPKKKRDVMVQTALDEKIPPTGKGVAKLEVAMDSLDGAIEDLISTATEQGGRVPASAVFSDLGKLRAKLSSAVQTDGLGNATKIDRVAKAIGGTQKKTGQEFYTVAELQQLKRNLYKSANMDVKQFKADDAVNQARKNIARKAKGMIEEKVPKVKGLNERYGRLIDLQDPLTRSANRIDNLNAISINQPLNVSAGGIAAGTTGAVSAGLLTALSSPKIKPQIAMYLNDLKKYGLLDLWMNNNQVPYYARQGLLQTEKANGQE